MKEIKLARIYPDYLNANGDLGNIFMLSQRAEVNDVKFSYEDISIKENIKPENYDFFYIGGMQDEFNPYATSRLLEQKDAFASIKESKKTLLGVCYGYQILGEYYRFQNKDEIKCLGLLDFFTIEKSKRHIGNQTSKMVFMAPNYLVGFENHKGCTYLGNGVQPLAYLDKGFGNNGSDKTEGAIAKNVIGTYLTGPFLPRNIYFADFLLKITMEQKYQEEFTLIDEENTLEEDVHFDFINAKY